MPFFGGFRSNSAKRNSSKTGTPTSSSGISNGDHRRGSGALDTDSERPTKPKVKATSSFKRFFTSSSQAPKKKKPEWDEDQHRRSSVARSDTFTMKQDAKPNYSRGTNSTPRDKTGRRSSSGGAAGRGVKTDVFEVLYQKPSSTRSSTQSDQNSHGPSGKYSASPSSPLRHPEFDGNTYRKPGGRRMDKWRQQEVHDDEDKKVLVGQNNLVDREKWNDNQFIKFDTQQRRHNKLNNGHPGDADDLKYRTVTKRTFRPDFVDPTDVRSLVWFVDASGEGGEGEPPKKEYSGPPVRLFNRKPVARTNTFRVEAPEGNSSSSIRDSGGFSNRHSLNEPIRVEIKNSDSGVKVIPVGVATPYNSQRNVTIAKRSPYKTSASHSSPFMSNEPIKIVIDRGNNSSVVRDRGSPPPPYSSQQQLNRLPQRTFSSSTVVLNGDNEEDRMGGSLTRRKNEYSLSSSRTRLNEGYTKTGGYDDVLNAVRAPNSFRQYTGNNAYENHNGMSPKEKPRFVSTVKVKPHHRPAWR